MASGLAQDRIEAYKRDGFVSPMPILSPGEAAAYLELKPGEASLYNVRTTHGSSPNRGGDRRIGLAIRYLAPHVRQMKADQDSAWLVRGEDAHGHFVHETPPKGGMDPAAVAERSRVMKLRQDVLYEGVAGKPAHL